MPARGKRRALGQHFLRDVSIAGLIAETAVEEARLAGCKTLLEVGPGRGAITELMLRLLDEQPDPSAGISRMILAERDRDLASYWRTQLSLREVSGESGERGNRVKLLVEERDFLELPEDRWLTEAPVGVASNLPYSAGTAIVTRLAAHPERIPVMVLMFQAEVAQRLRAEPGTKDWGSLSVWIQNRWDVRKLKSVRPGAFSPPPDVESEVVILTRRSEPRVPVARTPEQEAAWEKLLKTCFAHRRKMLRSGLPPGPHRKALEVSRVNGTKRAEALSWEEWTKIFEALVQSQSD